MKIINTENKIIKYSLFMVIIGFIISLSLSVINEITKPIIEKQKLEKVMDSLLSVDNVNKWIDGSKYINIDKEENIKDVFVALDKNNEYQIIAYLINTKGYSNGNIDSLIFLDYNLNTIKQVIIINIEDQTKGVGSLILDDPNYVKKYINIDIKNYVNDNPNNHISGNNDVITGATISSRAVIRAVINACNNYYNFKGEL